MKRIVLFVEGEGEADAAPKLVQRLIAEQNAWDAVFLDPHPFRVGQVNKLVKDAHREWNRKLAASLKKKDVGGVLVTLDGDIRKVGGSEFCAATVARSLAREAIATGASRIYSLAVVFALQEFESWLIAGVDSLAGKRLSDGRLISSDAKLPNTDLEQIPRNAKGWFSSIIEGGYKPTRDQAELTALVDLKSIRARNMRSFARLEAAVTELVTAIRNDAHVATPS